MLKFVAVVFFLLCIGKNLACKCVSRNDSEVYCSSDFVAHVAIEDIKVKNETDGKLHFEVSEFKVSFTKIFRQNKKFADTEKSKKIYSNPGCGVEVNVSSDAKKNNYLLAGYVVKGKAYIHSCGWVKNWNDVPDKMKKQLDDKDFDQDCQDKLVENYNQHLHDLKKQVRSNFTDIDEARNHTKRKFHDTDDTKREDGAKKKTPKNFLTKLFF